METIFDELKQFIVKKIVCSDEIDIDKKYLVCGYDKDKISLLVMVSSIIVKAYMNFTNEENKIELFEFEHKFNSDAFIEIFLRIVANNDYDDLGLNERKIILENDACLLYHKYIPNSNIFHNKHTLMFYKQAKLNGIDYFNDKYCIYFYI